MDPEVGEEEVKMAEASGVPSDESDDSDDDSDGDTECGELDTGVILAKVLEARQAAASGQSGPAALLFLQVLQQVPDLLPELEAELSSHLQEYAEVLVQHHGQLKQAVWLYEKATQSLPQSKLLWYNQGRFLYNSCGRALSSLRSFQRAVCLDPFFFPAIDAADNIRTLAVDRWHFRMLNDRCRNEAYARAIQEGVQRSTQLLGRAPVVLDIGTGTGFLSLLAVRAGAAHVYACDTNQVLCEMAVEMVQAHGMSDRITILHKASDQLIPGSADLPCGRVDLVVTELVDSGLLGEHILPVLRHARQHLLSPQHGIIIPSHATVHACVLESPDIRRRARCPPSSPSASPFETEAEGGLGGYVLMADEAYTCESLPKLLQQPHTRLLTRPVQVGVVPLCWSPSLPLSLPSPQPHDILASPALTPLHVCEGGGCGDGVAMWFDLHLLQWDPHSCVVSTAPERLGNGWDQGIFFLSPPSNFTSPVAVGQGAHLRCHVATPTPTEGQGQGSEQLRFEVVTPTNGEGEGEGQAMARAMPRGQPHHGECCGEMDVALANDALRQQAYTQALRRVVCKGGGGHVLEWSADFSTVPLAALTAGCERVTVLTGSEASARAISTSLGLPPPLPNPANVNGQPSSSSTDGQGQGREGGVTANVTANVTVTAVGGPPQSLARAHQALGGESGALSGNGNEGRPCVLVTDLVEGSGLLRQGAMQEIGMARDLLLQHQHCKILPAGFEVVVQCFQCPHLLNETQVWGANTCGLDLSPINTLGTLKLRELSLQCPSTFHPLSAPQRALAVDVAFATSGGPSFGDSDDVGRTHLLLPITAEGDLHAIGFWFTLRLDEETELSTGPPPEGQWSAFRQGAVLVPRLGVSSAGWSFVRVKPGDRLGLDIVCTKSRGVDIFLADHHVAP